MPLAIRNPLRAYDTMEFFQRCDVIGMTTTGAAKNRRLLSLLKCRMVLVEEAAQVLEPHVIAALPPTCDHLVMIGESDTI